MSKGCTEDKILDAVRYAIENKFDKIKFFMIADWEWETQADTAEIINLGKKIVEMKRTYGSTVAVRFSWTPLLIEAWTPLQWCRGVVEDKKLVGVYEQLKPLGIAFTLGKKTERNYYYFMQGFHMADPLLAEVMLRVADRLDQSYCGAVDRKWVVTMEEEMAKEGLTWDHYFRAKDYDEEFWWDIIDLDIPKKWFMDYHKKMRAMIDATDQSRIGHQPQQSELVQIGTALGKADKTLRLQTHLLEKGQLVGNCDTVCSACMACETNSSGKVDFYKNVMLPEYWKKNAVNDEKFASMPIVPVDDKSVAKKMRIKVCVAPDKRFMPNDYWVATIRRAAYMADIPIGKYAIRLASSIHGYKPWIAGTDYLELGIRIPMVNAGYVIGGLNAHGPNGMNFLSAKYLTKDAEIRGESDYMGLFRYELDEDLGTAKNRLDTLMHAETFEMSMKRDEYRKGLTTVKLNVHDWLLDAWLEREEHKLVLFMMMRYGEPTPYNIIASVFKLHEAEARSNVCSLVDLYLVPQDTVDFFTPQCVECGDPVPVNVLGEVFSREFCPKCLANENGMLMKGYK